MSYRAAKETLRIRLLGDLKVEFSDGRSGPAVPRKGWAILAFLAASPSRSHPRERLAGMFWPDLSDAAARNNLRQVLLGLHRALNRNSSKESCVMADRQSVRLCTDDRCRVDLIDFVTDTLECSADDEPSRCASCLDTLESLASLSRGEFMDGFALEDCPDFEEWLQVHREALHRRMLELLERLARCHEALGNLDRALAAARRYVELEPWDEEGQRRLIRLLALNGRRGSALNQYESCRRELQRELGVLPEEETRTLAVQVQRGEIRPPSSAPGMVHPIPPLPQLNWERRQVTVLYCHLAAKTSDDPDEILAALRKPQATCIQIIRQFSGHVVRTNDGGLLAYFGFPTALEHAALLAVRAGLTLAGLSSPDIDVRVGIHTGLIIAGGDPGVPDAIGRTSGLAVRLRHGARRGEVIVSATTKRLIDGYFAWEAPRAVPGFDDAVPREAFPAIRESGAATRLEASSALTPLAGREIETAALSEYWTGVLAGHRRALLLRGDPGIGKSRLVHFMKSRVERDGGAVRELRCFPEFSQSPFHPLAVLFESQFGFGPEDAPEDRFAKMVAYQERNHAGMDLSEVVPLFAAMLSLPIAQPFAPPAISLPTQRERIMGIVATQLHRLAEESPVLVILEDLHWCDPTTLELLSRILAMPETTRVLVLCTARPEFSAPWSEIEMPEQRLTPLGDCAICTLVEALGLNLPPETVAQIAARVDGVPLYAEAMAHAIRAEGQTALGGIPSTLQDLLAARLDAVADAKPTAQLAASVGREFSFALLRELSPLGAPDLSNALSRLRDVGLLSQNGEEEFSFRHALFQDAAYRSQTREDRRAVHRRIAETLIFRFPDIARFRPEILARHWSEAGEYETAIEFWIQAGRLANLHCAKKEAIGHFDAGLALIAELPEGQRQTQLEFEVHVGLGAAHFAIEGYGSTNGASSYAKAVALGESHAATADLFNALWGLWACTSSRTDYDKSLSLTLRLLWLALRDADPVPQQQAHFAVGNIRFWRGEFVEARTHLERAMELYKPEHHERLVTDFGENAYVTSGAYLSWTLSFLGYPDQAESAARKALDEAYRTGHPFSLGYLLTFVTVLQRILRRPAETIAYADKTIALAEEHGFPLWKAGTAHMRGWALIRQGHRDGMGPMRASESSIRALMSGIMVIVLETLADALRELGAFAEALTVIGEAWGFVQRLGDRHVEAELHRLEGECLLGLPDRREEEAEARFLGALSVARRQNAKLLELRAARSLAALWRRQGQTGDARDLLSRTLAMFTEGFETDDLCRAREQLATLADP